MSFKLIKRIPSCHFKVSLKYVQLVSHREKIAFSYGFRTQRVSMSVAFLFKDELGFINKTYTFSFKLLTISRRIEHLTCQFETLHDNKV